MTLARRVARLEQQRPAPLSASDADRAVRAHLYHHLRLDELRELDQVAKHEQDGIPFTETEEQRVCELLREGHQRMTACPLPWAECRTVLAL